MKRLLLALLLVPGLAQAADLRVLTSGAFKAALDAMAPALERDTGQHLVIENATAGVVAARVRAGEAFDLVVLPPAQAAALSGLLGPTRPLARVGIGVAILAGSPTPDISTVPAVRAAVLAARAPAWIDPKAGGSSGIYLTALWERWGIAAQLAPKAVLVQGGLVTDKLLDGTADLVFQQVSELMGVSGVTVLGKLPDEIQNYTVYAAAVANTARDKPAAAQALDWLSGPNARPILQAKGMEAP